MTSPTTHEEKKPLSPEELLKPLRLRAATLRREVTTARESIATYEQYKTEGAVQWASERIAGMNEAIQQREPELAATEQAIAIITVITDPGFRSIGREYTGEGFMYGIETKYTDVLWADTPLDALLKAHTALQEQQTQEGALPRKEGLA